MRFTCEMGGKEVGAVEAKYGGGSVEPAHHEPENHQCSNKRIT